MTAADANWSQRCGRATRWAVGFPRAPTCLSSLCGRDRASVVSVCATESPRPASPASRPVTAALCLQPRRACLLRRHDLLRSLQLHRHLGDRSCRFCPEGAVHVDPGLAQGHADLGMRVPHSGCCSSSGADQDVSRRETNCPRDGTVFGRLFACRMSQL